MSRVGGKIRVGRVTPIQQFFFFLASLRMYFSTPESVRSHRSQLIGV